MIGKIQFGERLWAPQVFKCNLNFNFSITDRSPKKKGTNRYAETADIQKTCLSSSCPVVECSRNIM